MTRFLLFSLLVAPFFASAQLNCLTSATVCDDFEAYTDSIIGPQSTLWTTWSGVEGGAGEGIVTSSFAYSGIKSLVIKDSLLGQDALLLLGNQTTGTWSLRWKMYVPANKGAYFNLQTSETPAIGWNYEIYMAHPTQGVGNGGIGTGVPPAFIAAGTFTFPHDAWFDVEQYFDLDANQMILKLNGQVVYTNNAFAGNLGSIDFFAASSGNWYYVDDIQFASLSSCPTTAEVLVCEPFESYSTDQFVNGIAPWWWSGTGTDVFGSVSDTLSFQSFQSMEVKQNPFLPIDPTILDMASVDFSMYDLLELSFKVYVPTGNEALINGFKSVESQTENFRFYASENAFTFYSGATTPIASGAFDGSTWHDMRLVYHIAADSAALFIDGAYITDFAISNFYEAPGNATTFAGLGFVGYSADAGFHIDNILVTGLLLPEPTFAVTFKVDMQHLIDNGGDVSANGMHVAGNFQGEAGFPTDWQAGDTPMAQETGTNVWSVTVNIPAGNYLYKFINGNVWNAAGVEFSEQNIGTNCDQPGNNRSVTVSGEQTVIYCFDHCVQCAEIISAKDILSANQFELSPNPANDLVNLRFVGQNGLSNLAISVIDLTGRVLLVSNTIEKPIDVSTLAAGTYWINIQSDQGRIALPLVVGSW
jgi:Secretion system C-terminal sorting domain